MKLFTRIAQALKQHLSEAKGEFVLTISIVYLIILMVRKTVETQTCKIGFLRLYVRTIVFRIKQPKIVVYLLTTVTPALLLFIQTVLLLGLFNMYLYQEALWLLSAEQIKNISKAIAFFVVYLIYIPICRALIFLFHMEYDEVKQ